MIICEMCAKQTTCECVPYEPECDENFNPIDNKREEEHLNE